MWICCNTWLRSQGVKFYGTMTLGLVKRYVTEAYAGVFQTFVKIIELKGGVLASVDVTSHKPPLIRNLVKRTSVEAIFKAIENTVVNEDCFIVNESIKGITNRWLAIMRLIRPAAVNRILARGKLCIG